MLIVDDESHIRTYIKFALKSIGIKDVTEAENGQQGYEVYKELSPDVVILDINMPGWDGIETLQHIRKLDPEAIVIMLTSQASRQMVERSDELGAAQYIRKDASREELVALLKETFETIEYVEE